MTERAAVAGVGMVPFATPSKSDSYDVLAARAIRAALDDAGLELNAVQQAYAGDVYGDSTSGQNALYQVGMTGIPVTNPSVALQHNIGLGGAAVITLSEKVS